MLTNVETNIASADKDIMRQYAALVAGTECTRVDPGFDSHRVREDASMMAEVFGGSLEARRPRMLKTFGLRANALRMLHEQQIQLLSQFRAAQAAGSSATKTLLPKVILSINAIASGLRTTG